MKILHTSDLHLGKKLLEESFKDDQEYILNEIIEIIKEKDISVIMISGDIYDKTIPSAEAVNLFDKFLTDLSKMNVNVLITSGNHDSSERLSFGSGLFEKSNIHIATSYGKPSPDEKPQIKKVPLEDVDFYLLPFLKPFHLKHLMNQKEYENINDTNDMMKWILSNEDIDKDKKNILLVHQFVVVRGEDPKTSDSESIPIVGTLDAIDVNLLDGFDYVALGHLHRPQKVKRSTVRYSGTPLKYSFSEVDDNKSVVIIDTDDIENIELVELKPPRNMRILRGTFEEVMKMEPSDDIIKVELEDENTLISPMADIQQRFENAIALEFVNKNKQYTEPEIDIKIKTATPYELFDLFFEKQNGREMKPEESEYIKSVFNSLMEGE